MGWSFSHTPQTREQVLERLCPAAGWKSEDGMDVTFTARKWTPQGVWGVLESRTAQGMIHTRCIAIARIARQGNPGYGEGGLWSETSGPYEDGCPISLLREVAEPVFTGVSAERLEFAANFRARVRAADTKAKIAKDARSTLAIGTKLSLPETWKPRQLTITRIDGRRMSGVTPEGRTFKITPRVLAAATLSL